MFFGWDADMAARGVEARDKIDGIRNQLPDDLERVFVRKFTSADEPILGLRIGSERDLSNAYELLDRNVRRRLERPGRCGQCQPGRCPANARSHSAARRSGRRAPDRFD